MDVKRRYDMQEARLAQHLAQVFGVSRDSGGRGLRLSRWNADGSSGCLGTEVGEILAAAAGVSASLKTALDGGSVIGNRRATDTSVWVYFKLMGC